MTFEVSRELDKVINADHHDPFVVLGYHRLPENPGKVVVRSFQPHAESVNLVCGDGLTVPMYKMRPVGLFEAVVDYREPFTYHYDAFFCR